MEEMFGLFKFYLYHNNSGILTVLLLNINTILQVSLLLPVEETFCGLSQFTLIKLSNFIIFVRLHVPPIQRWVRAAITAFSAAATHSINHVICKSGDKLT